MLSPRSEVLPFLRHLLLHKRPPPVPIAAVISSMLQLHSRPPQHRGQQQQEPQQQRGVSGALGPTEHAESQAQVQEPPEPQGQQEEQDPELALMRGTRPDVPSVDAGPFAEPRVQQWVHGGLRNMRPPQRQRAHLESRAEAQEQLSANEGDEQGGKGAGDQPLAPQLEEAAAEVSLPGPPQALPTPPGSLRQAHSSNELL